MKIDPIQLEFAVSMFKHLGDPHHRAVIRDFIYRSSSADVRAFADRLMNNYFSRINQMPSMVLIRGNALREVASEFDIGYVYHGKIIFYRRHKNEVEQIRQCCAFLFDLSIVEEEHFSWKWTKEDLESEISELNSLFEKGLRQGRDREPETKPEVQDDVREFYKQAYVRHSGK